jgi:hypothetical protein
MATTLTNRIASSALNGEGVQVSLDSTDRASLATLAVGTEVTSVASSKKGIVVRVDVPGTTFIVAPNNQSARFDGTAVPGLLSVGETISY